MRLNNKGFALTSMIYMLLVLFLMIMLLLLANLAQRKVVLDKLKNDVKNRLDQNVSVSSEDLPYQNQTTGIYYETLELSLLKASSGDTIKVMKNVTDVSTPELSEGKDVKIDLAGYEVDLSHQLTNNGTMDIYSSVDGGSIVSPVNAGLLNIGVLTLNGTSSSNTMSIINNSTTKPSSYSILNNHGSATLNNNVTMLYNESAVSGTATRYVVTNSGNITVDGATLVNKMDDLDSDHGITNASTATNASITFNSGIIDTSGYALVNSGSTKSTTSDPAVKITGGTLKSSKATSVYNAKSGSMLYITGGEIYSTAAVSVSSAGNATMTGGTVIGYNDMCFVKTGTGSANISGGILKKSRNPITNAFISGACFQINDSSSATISGNAVVQNDSGNGSNVIYNNSSGTLTIEGDATVENKGSVIAGTNNVNGKIVVNGGTVKSNGGNVLANQYASSTSTKYGTIEVNGGTVTTTGSIALNSASSYGRIKVIGGNVTASGSNGSYGAIYNSKPNTEIEITGGKITSGGYSVYVGLGSDNTNTTMTGGELSTTGATSIYNRGNGATVTIGTLGAVSNTYPKISGRIWGDGATNGSGLITVNSGTITGTTASGSDGIYNVNSITINGGVISSSKRYGVISDNASSKITINGGTITSSASYAVTTANAKGGEIEINGGTIRSTANAQAINNIIGTTTIKGGTVECTGNASGVYATTGTVTIGDNSDVVSITSPIIKGNMYGVNIGSGTFNFYDGKITGSSGKSTSKNPTVVPSGYTRKIVVDGTIDTSTLGWATDSNDTLLQNDSTEYYVTRTSSEAANKVIKQYTISAPFAANEVYQVEFDAKGSGNLSNYFHGVSGYWQIARTEQLNGTVGTGSNGGYTINLTNNYTHYETRFTLKPTGSANVNKYLLFRLNSGNATAYVKNIKFYKIN